MLSHPLVAALGALLCVACGRLDYDSIPWDAQAEPTGCGSPDVGSGQPDPSFGTDGIAWLPFEDDSSSIVKDFVQAGDGFVYVLVQVISSETSNNAVVVMRLGEGGAVDEGWANGGSASLDLDGNDTSRELVIDGQGRFVVVGSTTVAADERAAVYRFLADGSVDTSFATDGAFVQSFIAADEVLTGVAIDGNERIVASGRISRSAGYVIRLDANGELDTGFDVDGFTGLADMDGSTSGAEDIAVVGEEIFVIGAYHPMGIGSGDFGYRRLGDEGSLLAVSNAGVMPNVSVWDGAMDSGGQVVTAGWSMMMGAEVGAVALFDSEGNPAAGFADGGTFFADLDGTRSHLLGARPDGAGRIVSVGYVEGDAGQDVVVLRLLGDGSLDDTFATDGVLRMSLSDANDAMTTDESLRGPIVDDEGRIVTGGWAADSAGNFDAFVARVCP